MDMNATREIMWNIPYSYKVAMYALFAASMAIFFYGFYHKLVFVTGNAKLKGLKSLLPKKLNWNAFFSTLFLQGKVKRDLKVGKFHGLIYYGFVILWIATDLVAIHYDTPFKVFQGPTYIIISFLADIAGLAIIAGIYFAYQRRYRQQPSYLSATHPEREWYMYIMLLNLVIVGYLIEGVRILGTGMPSGEAYYAPIGYGLAMLFQQLTLGDQTLSTIYRFLWFFHMLSTMVFVASIPFTKFSHFIFAPLSALFTPRHRAAVLAPMNFENENAETFGLQKLSQMTFKNKWDLLACVECGRCTQVCPANLSGKPLDPKTIITKARDFAIDVGSIKGNLSYKLDGDFWENPIYSENELDSCTTCGACMEECPLHIEHVDTIMQLKRYKALTLGQIPPAAADAVAKVKTQGNPWGIAQDDRFNWATGLDVPVIQEGIPVDYLYYVGCAGSYDAANQVVVKDTIRLLKKAGVSFAVMGKTEKCNGDPIRRFGDEYTFYEIAIENIANMKKYQFNKVVTHCPHCLHTIGKEYAKFENGSFETVHHTELLADLIKMGKLEGMKAINEKITFHDPCYLGRHHGAYDAPREVLASIPGLELNEMERSKDKALCCGMGGGNMWYEIDAGKHLVENRLHDIAKVAPKQLASACSYCMINFNSAKGHDQQTENLEVKDVASFLAQSILD